MTASSTIGDSRDIELSLSGKKIYGDDFGPEQIAEWFQREEQAYFHLATDGGKYEYTYHALNVRNGFRWLPKGKIGRVLGMGSAYGHELVPVLDRIERITILDPGAFDSTELNGVPIDRSVPNVDGGIAMPDQSFDLITCFGVLHHIPNVSRVVREMYRCLRPGGFALIREPIISMGDWRNPRPGLTPCERGLPLPIFQIVLKDAGFKVIREQKCVFSALSMLERKTKRRFLNSPAWVALDSMVCSLPIWSKVYHARSAFQKIRPLAVYYVLQRESS